MGKDCKKCRSKLIEEMVKICFSCDDLNILLNRMAEFFGNPLHITDPTYKVVASSSIDQVNDESWNDTVEFGYLSAPMLKNALHLHRDNISSDPDNFICFFCTNPGSPYEEFVSYIVYQGNLMGYLCMLAVSHQPTEDEIYVLRLLNKFLGQWLFRTNDYLQLQKITISEQILISLIENHEYDDEILQNRIMAAQLDGVNYFQLVNIYNVDKHRQIRDSLREKFPNIRVFYYHYQVIALFTFTSESMGKEKLFMNQLDNIIAGNDWIACTSDIFSDLKNLSLYYNRNRRVLEIANVCRQKSAGRTATLRMFEPRIYEYDKFKDIDFIYLNALSNGLEELLAHVRNSVLTIMEYDRKNSTSLFETLLCFLEQKQSYTRTAELMHTHKNTIIYRIERVKDLAGIELSEDGLVGSMYSSCVILQIYYILKKNDFPNIDFSNY